MTAANFPAWWAFCQSPTNDGHANDSTDDGAGQTRWGFTYPTWVEAQSYIGGSASRALFNQLTQDKAGALAQIYYWTRQGGAILPAGCDATVIDWVWTSGGAIREVQRKLGVAIDGDIGPETVGAITKMGAIQFITACYQWRVAYYNMLGFQTKFPGLYTRSMGCQTLSLGLIGAKTQ